MPAPTVGPRGRRGGGLGRVRGHRRRSTRSPPRPAAGGPARRGCRPARQRRSRRRGGLRRGRAAAAAPRTGRHRGRALLPRRRGRPAQFRGDVRRLGRRTGCAGSAWVARSAAATRPHRPPRRRLPRAAPVRANDRGLAAGLLGRRLSSRCCGRWTACRTSSAPRPTCVALVGLGIALFGRRVVARVALFSTAPWWLAGVVWGSVERLGGDRAEQWLAAGADDRRGVRAAASPGCARCSIHCSVRPARCRSSRASSAARRDRRLSSLGAIAATLTGYAGVLLVSVARRT